MMRTILAAAFSIGVAAAGLAQDYPARPVNLILTSAPGSSVEVLGRAFADGLSAALAQPVVPQNRAGGANVVGTALVAASKPDGYTLGFTASGPFASQPYLQSVPYKLDQFEFICQVLELQVTLFVRADSPYRTLDDVIAAARREPGKIAVGTVGAASIPHIAISQIEHLKGVKFNHIFYRGDAPALQGVLGGEIVMGGVALGTIADQPVRPLAIFGLKRVPTHPDLATGTELGYPIVKTGMVGFFAPRDLPQPVRAKLDRACADAAKAEPFLALAKKLNQPVEYVPGPEWEKRIADDAKDNKEVIERLGLKSQN